MRVRAKISEADSTLVRAGQPAKVRLDAYPDLLFDGVVEFISPMAVASQMSQKVRLFTTVVSIKGTHPKLMPDLSASVELKVAGGAR
jgi:multidrug efflux pump subunit AcrA (membrane-fusion protein)